jgi:hypothetical protein
MGVGVGDGDVSGVGDFDTAGVAVGTGVLVAVGVGMGFATNGKNTCIELTDACAARAEPGAFRATTDETAIRLATTRYTTA